MNCQPASPLQREGCPDEEVTRASRCRAPSAGVECNGGTCGGTTRICIRGDNAGSMTARTVRRTRLRRIPPSWTGEIIFWTRSHHPSTIRLPHIKGSTPHIDTTPTESELAGSERGGSGMEEEEAQDEGDDPESFTGIWLRKTDTESEHATPSILPVRQRNPRGPGRDKWRRRS